MNGAPTAIPPHNLEAERAILGAVMFARVIDRVAEHLTPADFFADTHGRIFAAALRARAAGQAVDSITVRQALSDTDQLDAIGGHQQLALLMEEAAIAPHLDEYVEIVREAATKRRLLAFAEHLGHGASNGTSSAALLAEMSALTVSLGSGRATAPRLAREGLDLALTWPGDLRIALTAIHIGRDGVKGELTVSQGGRRLHAGGANLASLSGREQLVKKLREMAPSVPWREYLEDACARLSAAAREGEPITTLTGIAPIRPLTLMPRFLRAGETTVLYADGGSGKSLFALGAGRTRRARP